VIRGINESLLSTLAACGDVNRNVTAPPTPAYTLAREQVYADCKTVALALAPKTKAYHAIRIDGMQLNLDDAENKNFTDPLYRQMYLPRKFKTSFAIPPVNDVDVFTNDQGYIAIIENEQLVGYNLAVGGSMGRSHGNAATYPRLADVIEEDRDTVTELLTEHGTKTGLRQATPLHAAAMARLALPTCGLVLAESERMLPGLLDRLEKLCEAVGLAGEEIVIRSTGCPNGCSRPYTAELAFVGKAPGRYQIWLGGDLAGTRMARVWKEVVKDTDIESELRPVLLRYANERFNRESFGDWCDRVLLNEPATEFSI
jgi:sulfite reductase beta subunit-like hemoprotein